MSSDALALIALIHRLAAVDRYARERVARLLCIRDNQAAALLGIADGRAVTIEQLAAELDMSAGGARAFAHWLQVEALVRPEPVAAHQSGIALRLAPGAANELAAALAPLTDRLEPVAANLDVVATQLTALAAAVELVRAQAGDAALPSGPATIDDNARACHQR
jgi:hypothetical protein